MKLFKILSHPHTLIICFLVIMISGEHLGGFYALYILIGLPFGAIHSLLAIAGIVLLLVSNSKLKGKAIINPIVNLCGVLFLFSSIYYFFWRDKQHYNWGSFEQTVPIISMVLASFVGLCFLLRTIINLSSTKLSTI